MTAQYNPSRDALDYPYNAANDSGAASSSSNKGTRTIDTPYVIHSGLQTPHIHPHHQNTSSFGQDQEHRQRARQAYADSDVTVSRCASTDSDMLKTNRIFSRRVAASEPPSSDRNRRHKAPTHRGPRGAAEPESGESEHEPDDDEEEDGGDSDDWELKNRAANNAIPAGYSAYARYSVRNEPTRQPGQDAADHYSAELESSFTSSSYTTTDCSSSDLKDEEENRVRSLTRQLAETAVGVREMSKQLGRVRVKSTINSILIITKARDNNLIKLTRKLALWLMLTPRNGSDRGVIVYVDSQLRTSKRFDAAGLQDEHPELFLPYQSFSGSSSKSLRSHRIRNDSRATRSSSSLNSSTSNLASSSDREEGQLRYWTADMCSRSPHLFDFVVTLGGDGTVLFCSWLFQRVVPPVMPFALGSLGFLTNFDFSDYQTVMKSALEEGIRVNLRMRFTATVYRATLPSQNTRADRRMRRAMKSGQTGEIITRNIEEGGWDCIERPGRSACANAKETPLRKDREVMCFSTRPVETFEVLNDLVVDRGPSPYVSLLEIFGDEHHMTTAQADGLCISTPTGSTAYSLSAGGSLVHPEIPAILITPICPHTLSFRPMLLPDSMELRIAVPYNSRSTAWASFDGRGRVELKQGDHIKVTASRYPFPTICQQTQSVDWFKSISRTLKWNERQRQKSFVVFEEDRDTTAKQAQPERRDRRQHRCNHPPLPSAEQQRCTREAEDGLACYSEADEGPEMEDIGADQDAVKHMPEVERHERGAVEKSADRSKRVVAHTGDDALSGPAKSATLNHADGCSHEKTDKGEDEDDNDDEDEDELGEETFDIDDTSTAAATQASSVQPQSVPQMTSLGSLTRGLSIGRRLSNSLQRHGNGDVTLPSGHHHSHHYHHHHGRASRAGDGQSLRHHSAPGSAATSDCPSFEGLSILDSFTALDGSRIEFDRNPHRAHCGVTTPPHTRQVSNSLGADAESRQQYKERSQDHQHNLLSSEKHSHILHSPDRFNAAGPPEPPRAMSSRHLTNADFRLDSLPSMEEGTGRSSRSKPAKRSFQDGPFEQDMLPTTLDGGHLRNETGTRETLGALRAAEHDVKTAANLLNQPLIPSNALQAPSQSASRMNSTHEAAQISTGGGSSSGRIRGGTSRSSGRATADSDRRSGKSSSRSRRMRRQSPQQYHHRSISRKSSGDGAATDEQRRREDNTGGGGGRGGGEGGGRRSTALVVYGEDEDSSSGSGSE